MSKTAAIPKNKEIQNFQFIFTGSNSFLLNNQILGSSVKCVDAFRIALTEEPKLLIKQKHG